MIIRKGNKNDGEGITLKGLFKELNDLFKDDGFVTRNDDPKFGDIKSMVKSLVDGEAEFSEKEDKDSIEIGDNVIGGLVGYNTLMDAIDTKIVEKDEVNDGVIPVIGFISTPQMMEGVVETIRSMKRSIIVGYEGGKVIKAYVACGDKRDELIREHGAVNALVFDEDGGMCRLSINRKDGYDFILGENDKTRFIIFDETVCPATIPTDIIQDNKKWDKRMSKEIPQLIEKRIEESKEKKTPLCNLPETCAFDDVPSEVKKPIISDIMKDFADAKGKGKVKDDTFVEFMKPENKEAVANAVTSSLTERTKPIDEVEISDDEAFTNDVMNAFTKSSYSERWERDSDEEEEEEVEVEDTNPDCFRCVVDYMAKEGVDSIHFWTDENGHIHCDVSIKTVYIPELTEKLED